jgi:glycosyltransferase involved in cell wall biosynthesis
MPRISIVMPTLNQQRYLRTAVDSILNQPCEVEVIVIDGGSTDGSLDILKSYGDQIRYVSEPDQGQSDALNKGLRMASGEIIGWLNSDDVYRPHAFRSVLQKFDDPNTHWVFGKVDVINEEGVEIRQWITSLKNRRLARLTFNQLLRANWISQMGVFWRREFLTSVGGVEPNYHLAMDYDLWLRFWKKAPGAFLNETIASFRIYGSSKSGGQYRKQLREAFHIASLHAAGHHQLDLACHRFNSCMVSFIYRTLHLFG